MRAERLKIGVRGSGDCLVELRTYDMLHEWASTGFSRKKCFHVEEGFIGAREIFESCALVVDSIDTSCYLSHIA